MEEANDTYVESGVGCTVIHKELKVALKSSLANRIGARDTTKAKTQQSNLEW
jgi:hypothetical protein